MLNRQPFSRTRSSPLKKRLPMNSSSLLNMQQGNSNLLERKKPSADAREKKSKSWKRGDSSFGSHNCDKNGKEEREGRERGKIERRKSTIFYYRSDYQREEFPTRLESRSRRWNTHAEPSLGPSRARPRPTTGPRVPPRRSSTCRGWGRAATRVNAR